MNKKVSNVVRRLVKLANRLDAKNKFVLADQTDALIQKIIKTADEDGSYMSVQSLRSIHDHSGELLKLINEETPLSDWIESKINRASSDILSIFEYMTYGVPEEDIYDEEEEEEEEEKEEEEEEEEGEEE